MLKLDNLETKLDNHIKDDIVEGVNLSRKRILRFNDELLHKTPQHSKEHFVEILSDIDDYEHYCDTHPDYPNNRAVLAIENIKRVYAECLKNDDFL